MSCDDGCVFEHTPQFFDALSQSDKADYRKLKKKLSNSKLHSSFDIFTQIQKFCIRNDEYDQARCLVCGTAWLQDGEIAINTRQLKLLTGLTRSSLSFALRSIGYSNETHSIDSVEHLVKVLPILKDNIKILKEWSIKKLEATTPSFNNCYPQMTKSCSFSSPPPESTLSTYFPNVSQTLDIVKVKEDPMSFFDDPFCLPPVFLLDDMPKRQPISIGV